MDSKKWLPIAAGVGVGIVGLLIYQKYAVAAPAAAPAIAPAQYPASATVALQPGATTVAVAPNGSVVLTLPAGASWSTSTTPIPSLASTGVQPTGTQSMNVTMGASSGVITANWTDSSGNAQSTTINVAVA
jgi:hypothetical protein